LLSSNDLKLKGKTDDGEEVRMIPGELQEQMNISDVNKREYVSIVIILNRGLNGKLHLRLSIISFGVEYKPF